MIRYFEDDCRDDPESACSLLVESVRDGMMLSIDGFQDEDYEERVVKGCIVLEKESVAALVGQLQSWLASPAPSPAPNGANATQVTNGVRPEG